MLRGWSHAIAAPIALGFTVALGVRCIGDGPRLASMLVYGLSLALMYGWSAAYHIVTWPRDRRRLMRQVDHANIYLVIAATSTAIGVNILGGWERTVVLAAIWVFAVCGMLATVLSARLPSALRVGLYRAVVGGDTSAGSVGELMAAGTMKLEPVTVVELPRTRETLGW